MCSHLVDGMWYQVFVSHLDDGVCYQVCSHLVDGVFPSIFPSCGWGVSKCVSILWTGCGTKCVFPSCGRGVVPSVCSHLDDGVVPSVCSLVVDGVWYQVYVLILWMGCVQVCSHLMDGVWYQVFSIRQMGGLAKCVSSDDSREQETHGSKAVTMLPTLTIWLTDQSCCWLLARFSFIRMPPVRTNTRQAARRHHPRTPTAAGSARGRPTSRRGPRPSPTPRAAGGAHPAHDSAAREPRASSGSSRTSAASSSPLGALPSAMRPFP